MGWIIRTCEDCHAEVTAVQVETGKLHNFPAVLCMGCWRAMEKPRPAWKVEAETVFLASLVEKPKRARKRK